MEHVCSLVHVIACNLAASLQKYFAQIYEKKGVTQNTTDLDWYLRRYMSNTIGLLHPLAVWPQKNTNTDRYLTSKLSYRKDDCSMCRIYECPENFRATFPEILMGFSSDWCYEYAYKI